jgi:hypothetical protein
MLKYSNPGTFAYGVLVASICGSRKTRLSGWINRAKALDCLMAVAMRLDRDFHGMIYLTIEKDDVTSSGPIWLLPFCWRLGFGRQR